MAPSADVINFCGESGAEEQPTTITVVHISVNADLVRMIYFSFSVSFAATGLFTNAGTRVRTVVELLIDPRNICLFVQFLAGHDNCRFSGIGVGSGGHLWLDGDASTFRRRKRYKLVRLGIFHLPSFIPPAANCHYVRPAATMRQDANL